MTATRPLQLTQEGSSPRLASRALVPFAEPAQWSRPATHVPAPDPSFVAQLIANAEPFVHAGHDAQESAAGALSAYRARQLRAVRTGRLMRQMI
jgi:hypothetical protein